MSGSERLLASGLGGRSAIVTGTSAGIGHATALACAADDAPVLVVELDAEGAERFGGVDAPGGRT
ncbi:hypothetical protein ACFWM5_22260 [Streptomyces bobili]|uniref:hypothetical protein n=1 Tax=Streptomyces bobili TaxID=67280 RepID=UPI00365A1C9C